MAVDDLWVSYGDLDAVAGVSFDVESGELVVLAGANGAGKTSTLEAIEGYRPDHRGSISILGQPPVDAIRGGVAGVMLQDDGIYPAGRVEHVLSLFADLHGAGRECVGELLALVGLEHRRSSTVRRLSGGEHRRLGLALALVGAPDVLLLDEPTAGVDAEGRQRIVDALIQHRDAGGTVVMTTHELGLAERVADRVVVLDRGVVVADGHVEELMAATTPSVRFEAHGTIDLGAVTRAVGAPTTAAGEATYVIAAPRTPQLIASLAAWAAGAGVDLGDIDDNRRTLEQVVSALIRDTRS